MGVVWALVAVAVVLLIAAVVVGRETDRLSGAPPRPVFDLDEAVTWVARHLPFEVSAVLSHDDVRQILRWNLDYFRSKGVTGNGSSASAPANDVVVGGGETVDNVLTRARSAGLEYTAPQVHAVLDAQMAYFEAIGALGPAPPRDEPPTA
ncbi:MAG TPA: hypothetical protein VEW93_15270 [Acidimicrobiales bacterium]|nr:hypothetical protein [Acidimicrobiales bacterium]